MGDPLPILTDDQVSRGRPAGAIEEAGFGALETGRGPLPLKAMEVRGRIDGLLSRTEVAQTFVNALDEPLEATYIFPLPDRAAVTGFRMEVAGRVVVGNLRERAEARASYDRAIESGRRASIAEEDRPGVFSLRVGNLLPGEEATVRLTLAGPLPYLDGEVTFRFPLVVAPRYVPGVPLPGPSAGDGVAVDTDAVPDASRISPPVLLPGYPNPVRLALSVEIHAGPIPIEAIRSSLHAVRTVEADGTTRVEVHPGERLNRDFVLRFRLGSDAIRTVLSVHPDPDGDGRSGTFALTVVPPAGVESAPRPRAVAFVLDRSGSMEGWKMVAARRALARMVDALNDRDRFAVLAFDTMVERPPGLPEGLTPAGDRDRSRAVDYLRGVGARGGTEMAEPLELAAGLLAGPEAEGLDRVLVLITDGQVGNEDQVLRALGPKVEGVRLFALGIDRAVNEGFLRRLVGLADGTCDVVETEDRLELVMASIHRRIGSPVLTELGLDADGLAIEADSVVPSRTPDLFAGAPLLVLGRYQGKPRGNLRLRARGPDGAGWTETIAASVRTNPAIASAWARARLRDLEDRYVVATGERPRIEREIVATSLKHGVLCRFTAYVAVDPQVVNEGGLLHPIVQPVEEPEGWGGMSATQSYSMPPGFESRDRRRMMSSPGFASAPPAFGASGRSTTDFSPFMACDPERNRLVSAAPLDSQPPSPTPSMPLDSDQDRPTFAAPLDSRPPMPANIWESSSEESASLLGRLRDVLGRLVGRKSPSDLGGCRLLAESALKRLEKAAKRGPAARRAALRTSMRDLANLIEGLSTLAVPGYRVRPLVDLVADLTPILRAARPDASDVELAGTRLRRALKLFLAASETPAGPAPPPAGRPGAFWR